MTTLAAPSPLPLRNREKPHTFAAVITASLVIHVLFFLLVALYLAFISAIAPAESTPEPEAPTITLETLLEPFELSKLDPLPVEPAPDAEKKSLRTLRAASRPSEAEAPENATFESDRNQTAAGSRVSADPTTKKLPSTTGTDRLLGLQLENSEFSETPEKPTLEQPDQIALPDFRPLISDPTAEVVPVPESADTSPTARRLTAKTSERRLTETQGTTNTLGGPAVNSADTPAGRYFSGVSRQVEVKWRQYKEAKRKFASPSTINVAYSINAAGDVINLKIINSDANPEINDATLNAILEADISPIPSDVLELLENGLLKMEYSFTLY